MNDFNQFEESIIILRGTSLIYNDSPQSPEKYTSPLKRRGVGLNFPVTLLNPLILGNIQRIYSHHFDLPCIPSTAFCHAVEILTF